MATRARRLERRAAARSATVPAVMVADRFVAVSGFFESLAKAARTGDPIDPVAFLRRVLGKNTRDLVDDLQWIDTWSDARTSSRQPTMRGLPVFGATVSVAEVSGAHLIVARLLSAAARRELDPPFSELAAAPPDPTAAIELVRRARVLPEDLEFPDVPRPDLVWFDPQIVLAEPGAVRQAWKFTFDGDRPGEVIVSLDGSSVLAVVATGPRPDNPFSTLTIPRFVLDEVTGVPRFVLFNPPLLLPGAGTRSAVDLALDLFHTFPAMFGTASVGDQLQPGRVESDIDGGQHVELQQHYAGLPVWGCRLIVHLTSAGGITSVSGRYARDPDVDPVPRLGEQRAFSLAVQDWITENDGDHLGPGETITAKGLVVLPWRLTARATENHLAWWFQFPDHDRFVSAETGVLVARIPRVHTARRIFDANGRVPGNGGELQLDNGRQVVAALAPEAAGADTATAAVEAFWRVFNRSSWNNGGDDDLYVRADFDDPTTTPAVEVNAAWRKATSAASFSPNFAEPDVVAHELTHAITQSTADLVYLHESGALNESYSDVLGKIIAPFPQRWTIGVNAGVNRRLDVPVVGQYRNFVVSTGDKNGDFGGVHTNSGIPNRAAFLTTDGVAPAVGLGRDKVTRIWWDTLTTRLTPWSHFVDMLVNSWEVTRELIDGGRRGVALPGATTPVGTFTAGDQVTLIDAFKQVDLSMELLTGWFSLPTSATRDVQFFTGLTTPPNERVSDVIVRVNRIKGDGRSAFLGVLQVTTGATSGSFVGGMVTAAITAHGVGTTSRAVTVRVTTTNYSDVQVAAQILTTVVTPAPTPPPPTLPYATPDVAHWFDNPFFAGRRYGDIAFQGATLPAGQSVSDVVLHLLDKNGVVVAQNRLGDPAAEEDGRGAYLVQRTLGDGRLQAHVRSWHDFGRAVRYRLVYFISGVSVALPDWTLAEVGPDHV